MGEESRKLTVRDPKTLMRTFRFALILLLLPLAGCAYTTATRLPPYAKSIAIPTFTNRSFSGEYTRRWEVDLTQSVRDEFLKNGRLKLGERDSADLILEGEFTKFDRTAVSLDRFGEAYQYRVRLVARVSLYDVKAAKYIVHNRLVASDQNNRESGTYSLQRGEDENFGQQKALEDITKNIVAEVMDQW